MSGRSKGLIRAIGRRCATLLAATSVGFILCEAVARLWFPAPPFPWRDPEIVYATDPELGYFHVPNQTGWIDDGLVTINALGFRGRELAEPKPKDRYRVVILGDSVALGWGVHDDATFPVQLEASLRARRPHQDLEVVNCAVSGYDTAQEAALFTRFAPRLEADLVLIAFYWNDILPANAAGDGETASAPSGQLKAGMNDAPRTLRMGKPFRWTEYVLMKSRALYCAGRAIRWRLTTPTERDSGQFATEQALLGGVESPAIARGWRRVETALANIGSAARIQGADVGIVVFPCKEQVRGEYANAKYQSVVKEIGRRHDAFVVDPLPAYLHGRPIIDELFIPYDRHHQTNRGLRIAAEFTADYLARRGVRSPVDSARSD